MSPDPSVDLVHAPLAHWAQTRGEAVAIRCGTRSIRFAQLQQQLTQRAQALSQARAPASVLVDAAQALPDRLVDFLGIIASGRCAVVGDPDWPRAVREAVRAALPTQGVETPAPQPTSPFYVGYTSGSTGAPKGYRRHHRSWTTSFQACLDAFGAHAGSCILAPGRDSHSLFLFGMLLGLWTGGGVEVQEQFSASAALDTLRSGRTPCLVAVPSQLLLMMETAQHRDGADERIGRDLRASARSYCLIPAPIADEAAEPEAGLANDGIAEIDSPVTEGPTSGACRRRIWESGEGEIFIGQAAARDTAGTYEALDEEAPFDVATEIEFTGVGCQLIVREP